MDGTPIIIKKKKSHGHGGHHGGSWKVAYADFVTAMMAFFMVMWIMGLSDETKAQISGYFNDPLGYSKTEPLSDNIVTPFGNHAPKPGNSQALGSRSFADAKNDIQMLGENIKNTIQNGGSLKELLENINFELTDEGLRIEFVENAGSVFFDSGQATIKPKARELIMKIAPILARSGRYMDIEGHTDSVPYGRSGYDNMDLSLDRAQALRAALHAGGLPKNRVRYAKGCADFELKIPSDPTNPANRRVTVLLPLSETKRKEVDLGEHDFSVKPNIAPEGSPVEQAWISKDLPKLGY